MNKIALVFCVIIISLLTAGGVSRASTDNPASEASQSMKEWYIGPRIGLSWYTGLLGLELQHRHVALAGGLPGNIGLKYYINPHGHSLFFGGYFMQFTAETSDLPVYLGSEGETQFTEGGFGGGYRFFWNSGWNVSVSIALSFGKEEERNGPMWRDTYYIGTRPGVAAGYSF